MYNGKYIKLSDYLKGQSNVSSLTLNIKEIEEILGFQLPNSAYKYSAWWSNEEEGTHTQARSWLLAGWRTLNVKLGESVTFQRKVNERGSS